MLNPHSLTEARLEAGLDHAQLATHTARIGHRWLTAHDPDGERGPLREDLAEYIRLAEHGQLDGDNALPATHPYLGWLAQALGTTVLQLIDEPPGTRRAQRRALDQRCTRCSFGDEQCCLSLLTGSIPRGGGPGWAAAAH